MGGDAGFGIAIAIGVALLGPVIDCDSDIDIDGDWEERLWDARGRLKGGMDGDSPEWAADGMQTARRLCPFCSYSHLSRTIPAGPAAPPYLSIPSITQFARRKGASLFRWPIDLCFRVGRDRRARRLCPFYSHSHLFLTIPAGPSAPPYLPNPSINQDAPCLA